jgi:hypothetical protein
MWPFFSHSALELVTGSRELEASSFHLRVHFNTSSRPHRDIPAFSHAAWRRVGLPRRSMQGMCMISVISSETGHATVVSEWKQAVFGAHAVLPMYGRGGGKKYLLQAFGSQKNTDLVGGRSRWCVGYQVHCSDSIIVRDGAHSQFEQGEVSVITMCPRVTRDRTALILDSRWALCELPGSCDRGSL